MGRARVYRCRGSRRLFSRGWVKATFLMTQRSFQSLAQAVETYYEELRLFVRRRTGSASLADDIAQETWIRASTTSAAMPDNPRAYLYRMAGNLAIDQLRRQDTQVRSTAEDIQSQQIACSAPAPDAVVAGRQEFAILTEAVQGLPEKCRLVFLLYRGQGLTMRQIAKRLDISEKTVEKHIARAMVDCRRRLRQAGRDV